MSKKIFAALIVAVVATFAGYNIYQSQRAKNTMSELAMANVEALAGGEWGTGFNCRWADGNYWFCTPLGDGLGCPCFM